MGGLGVTSWRHGTQADNCLELQVVTGQGEIVRCTADGKSRIIRRCPVRRGAVWSHYQAKVRLRDINHSFGLFTFFMTIWRCLLDDLRWS